MCVVSMVTDFYREKWPLPMMPVTPFEPVQPPENPLTGIDVGKIMEKIKKDARPPMRVISEEEWNDYQALKRKAVEYDITTQQPDCVKPDVEAWENDIEAFLILMGWYTKDGDVSTD